MRVLDLFCGAGGAAMGLHRAWPDAEIMGVDINPQPHYPFRLIQTDVMDYLEAGHLFAPWGAKSADFIWAIPPCQRYSVITPERFRENHADILPLIADRLATHFDYIPYAIENVVGARKKMHEPFMLCGSMFGLRSRRHRLFETNFPCAAPKKCDH